MTPPDADMGKMSISDLAWRVQLPGDTPLDSDALDIEFPTLKSLLREGISTLEHLGHFTDEELLDFRWFGAVRLFQLRAALVRAIELPVGPDWKPVWLSEEDGRILAELVRYGTVRVRDLVDVLQLGIGGGSVRVQGTMKFFQEQGWVTSVKDGSARYFTATRAAGEAYRAYLLTAEKKGSQ